MKVIDKEILIKVLRKVFENNLEFIDERRVFAGLIYGCERDFFKEINDEEAKRQKENTDYAMTKKLANQEYKEEYLRIKKDISDTYSKKRENLENNVGNKELTLLLNEFKEKYQNPIVKNGFINEAYMSDKNIVVEFTKYEKVYGDILFSINFTGDFLSSENNNLISMSISSTNTKNKTETAHITISFENNNMEIVAISTNKAFVTTDESGKDMASFLKTIKEEDLFNLDSEENEDIHIMLHDYSLKLSEQPIYKVLKTGLKEFQERVKKELIHENKITNKI